MTITYYAPQEIEKKSFAIIERNLHEKGLDKKIDPSLAAIIKRCIHTSADFDYAETLYFSPGAVETIANAMHKGCHIVTDTKMALAGINKAACDKFGIKTHCFISDDDVAREAKENNDTRAATSMNKAMTLGPNTVFFIGNAPTALIRLHELQKSHAYSPAAVVGVPVGFVNVVESKELIMSSQLPCIINKGNKGGSNIAAAICNAIIYSCLNS